MISVFFDGRWQVTIELDDKPGVENLYSAQAELSYWVMCLVRHYEALT